MSADYGQIVKDGLWKNNGVLCMMLGLCPAMAMTGTATNGLGMGLATTVVMASSSLMVALLRNYVTHEIRIPTYILMVATNVTVVDMVMNAWLHELYKVLGLFIPLIVANCLPLARMEAFAAKERPLPSLVDGTCVGLGFTFALVLIGGVREIIGQGTLFADAALLLGPAFKVIELRIMPADWGILVMILPPGAFLVAGLLVVAKRMIDLAASGKTAAAGVATSA
ncbi:electron transport complex subunit E [Magnetospirillum sp. SS-4]|uniref:electron transport complex subunit E n=1 Tax=Magnetospirillum sp. SS-4 TaxID=2681465 RepID=UPI00137CF1E4|nr:electron transport complex subunit E [Magnetospirillum sp. SS-4]CAA7616353.1 putative inner membrane NADH-quinone reductase [Magnetospirillum sp. SS-4]